VNNAQPKASVHMLSVAEHGSKPRNTLFATVQSTDKVQSAKSAAFAEQNRQPMYANL